MNHILVIEDERNVLTLCRHILQKAGFDVSLASTRADARTRFLTRNVDLIIADCTLGFYVGESLIDNIMYESPDTGVIVISGYFNETEIEELLSKGVFRCIPKPFRHNDLLKAVEDYFKIGAESAAV
jgi:two-component system OmpR family response regulator